MAKSGNFIEALNHHLKVGASIVFSSAVRGGRLVRPSTCEDCGAGGRIEGHHCDYAKPLDVVWVCIKCHRRRHYAPMVEPTVSQTLVVPVDLWKKLRMYAADHGVSQQAVWLQALDAGLKARGY